MSVCLYCSGLGSIDDGYHVRKCSHCKGTGCNQLPPLSPFAIAECSGCEGIGFQSDYCTACNGSGEGMADGTYCNSCAGCGVEFTECEICRGTGEIEKEISE